MSRKLVWLATFLLCSALSAIAAPAFAQYPGYGAYDTDPYRTRLHDYGPGYNGGLGYETRDQSYYIDEYGREYHTRNGQVMPPPDSDGPVVYSDPLESERHGGFRAEHDRDYQLGEAANQKTGQMVEDPTHQAPGTLVVDTNSKHLYLVMSGGRAMEYGIGVGREGFAWKGAATVQRKAEWPDWIPPSDMLKRRPDLPTRMAGGIENPLGARALYLYQGKRDTLFRIHGTNEPDTIGKAVSSGCIRMMNADVIDLYSRVPIGTKVVVL